jgi:tetratricopeptide (TPR) repeat protein
VLYELLTGRGPIGDCRTPFERLGAIRDTVPTPPSRIHDREIPGKGSSDLDAICLKALRAEPLERYPSAEALREDLIRYQEKRPVRARKGGAAYLLRKFVRRNRVTVGAVSVVMLAILASALISLRQANLAAAERDRALKAEGRARAINDFLVHDMLEAAMPEESRGADLKVSEVLEAASRRIEGSLEGEPELEADVRLVLGRAYLSLGEQQTARQHAESAVALRAGALGESDPETLDARSELAGVYLAMGDYGAARDLLEPTLSAQRGTEGPEGLASLVTEGRLAETLLQEGSYLAAESRFKDVLSRIERVHPDAWRERLLLRAGLGRALNLQRKDSESEAFLRETLSLQSERLGREHPDTLATMSLLMDSLRRLLRYHEAIPLAEESIRHHEALYGRGHPETLNMLTMLAGLLWYEDRERVEGLLLEVLARSRESLGLEHPKTLSTLMNLAQNAKMLKKYDVAEPRYREALSLSRRVHGDEHTRTLRCLRYLAVFLTEVGRDPEAREVFREILTISERMASRPDADATFLNDYAWLLMTYVPEDMRDPARGLPLAERAVALTDRKQIEFLHSLARAYRQTGRLDDAIATLREIYALPDSVHRYDVERDMVEYLVAKGDPRAVEDFLLENLARRRQVRDPADPLIAETLRLLGVHYLKEGRYAEAEERLRAAIDIYRMRSPEDARDVARAESELGEVLLAGGRTGEAETLLVRSYRNLEGKADLLPAARERLKKLEEVLGRSLFPTAEKP